jgi:hypothetical protein
MSWLFPNHRRCEYADTESMTNECGRSSGTTEDNTVDQTFAIRLDGELQPFLIECVCFHGAFGVVLILKLAFRQRT